MTYRIHQNIRRLHSAPRLRFAMRAISHSLLLSLVTSPLLSSIAAAQTMQNTNQRGQHQLFFKMSIS
jgi:hypothetical protein